jgi:ABC-type dipeptide/oligopeptide/nickel transport system permease component
MSGFLSNLPALIIFLALVAVLVFTGFRLGIRFLIRRLAGMVFVLLGVTFLTFILGYLAPSDAIFAQLGQHYTPEAGARLRHLYGLDLPWYQQYLNYLNNLLHFNLGTSYIDDNITVWSVLQRYLPASFMLGSIGTVLAIVTGVPLGLIAAVRANTRQDTAIQSLGLVLYALPSFVLIPFYQIFMVYLYERGVPSLAVSGWGTINTEIAPIVIFAAGLFAYYVRITRASMLEVLGQDYVRTARAKGLTERVVIRRHAFRNALIPLLTAIGPALAFAVVGVFVVEQLFNIPGIGSETIAAALSSDFPIVQATGIVLALAIVFMNLITDVAYGFADPRIKSE